MPLFLFLNIDTRKLGMTNVANTVFLWVSAALRERCLIYFETFTDTGEHLSQVYHRFGAWELGP